MQPIEASGDHHPPPRRVRRGRPALPETPPVPCPRTHAARRMQRARGGARGREFRGGSTEVAAYHVDLRAPPFSGGHCGPRWFLDRDDTVHEPQRLQEIPPFGQPKLRRRPGGGGHRCVRPQPDDDLADPRALVQQAHVADAHVVEATGDENGTAYQRPAPSVRTCTLKDPGPPARSPRTGSPRRTPSTSPRESVPGSSAGALPGRRVTLGDEPPGEAALPSSACTRSSTHPARPRPLPGSPPSRSVPISPAAQSTPGRGSSPQAARSPPVRRHGQHLDDLLQPPRHLGRRAVLDGAGNTPPSTDAS